MKPTQLLFFSAFFSFSIFSNAQEWHTGGNTLTGTSTAPTEYFGSNNAYDVVFKTGGTERARFASSNGYFGINSASFSRQLNVGTSQTNGGIRVTQTALGFAALELFNTGAGGRNWAIVSTNNTNSEGNGCFGLYDYTAGTYRMFVTTAGNIGIGSGFTSTGTSAVLERLHVLGNGVFSSTTGTPTSSAKILGINTYGTASAPEYTWYADENSGMFHKSADVIGFTTNGTERMTLKNEGTVVINGGGTNTRIAAGSVNGMGFGTSYVALNAQRIGTNWTKYTDGANNGGSVLWGTVAGNMCFSPLPITSTGASDATIPDADVVTYKTMEVRWNNTLTSSHKGQVIIGANTVTSGAHTDFKLSVDGKINAKDIVVTYQNWPDYVFEKEYKLLSLEEVKTYIEQNKHLPAVKAASEITADGLSLKDETNVQMQKIEELTLYMIQLNEELKKLKKENELLKQEIKAGK
jgi:hypothetical protein